MRAILALLLVCGIWFSLIVGAFALDQLGLAGRILGTIMLAVAFWGTGLVRASRWVVEGTEETSPDAPTALTIEEESEPEPLRPWWRRRYTLAPAQVLLLSGLTGIVGCVVSIYLNELSLLSFLVSGGFFGALSVIVVATGQLQDERHPHHDIFLASTSQLLRVAFVVLFVLGFWQGRPTRFVLLMLFSLGLLTHFTVGAIWSFALMVRAAVRTVSNPDG
jgi:hypothetical protein